MSGRHNNGPKDVPILVLGPADMSPHIEKGLYRRDEVKTPKTRMTLDYPGDPVSSQGPHKREAGRSESELEEAALLAVMMEEGATSQGSGASRSCKVWKQFSLEPPEGPALPTPGFGTSDLQNCLRINVCGLKLLNGWSQKTQTQSY